MEDVRRSLLLTHTLWGGKFNPIIPVGPGVASESIFRKFRVDVLSTASKNVSELAKFVDSFADLRWPDYFWSEDFFWEVVNGMEAPFLDISHPTLQLHEEYVKREPVPKISIDMYSWDASDPLSDVFLAQFGAYPPESVIKLDYAGYVTDLLNGVAFRLEADKPIPDDIFRSYTPSVLTEEDLNPDFINPEDEGFYLGQADNFDDIVNFWNLRAADVGVFFFDPGHEDRLGGFRDRFVEALHNRPREGRRFEPSIAVWSKEGSSPPDAKVFGNSISGGVVRAGLPNLSVPLMQFDSRPVLASVSQSSGRSRISFQLPEKPYRESDAGFRQKIVAEIRHPSGFGAYSDQTFMVPFFPELNPFYRSEMAFGHEIRVQQRSFGVIASANRSDMTISALQTTKVFEKTFELFGIRAEPSLPGRIAKRLIHQMNGFQGCRIFKLPGVRKLIEEYSPLQSFTRGKATLTIAQVDPTTQQPNIPTIFIDGEQLTPDSAFDYLLKTGAFRAGLELTCPNCTLAFWLSLEPLADEVTCEYCGTKFNVTPQLKDRDWRFRRSGLFGRADHRQGAIPVALTLQQLDSNTHSLSGSRLFATSFNLSSAGARINPCEIDLVMLNQDSRGRIQIAIGECKSSGAANEITEGDVRNLSAVADAFPPERVEAFIIFSKTGIFSDVEIKRCMCAQSTHQLRVILLSHRELEPYHVYEDTAKEFDIRQTAISLDDFALATPNIFFQPKFKASRLAAGQD
jgi:hypothetical protein